MTLNFVQGSKIAEAFAGVGLVDAECGVACGGVACRWWVQDLRSGKKEGERRLWW